jgi:H+-transporting ATPase
VVEKREHGVKRIARHIWAPVPWMLEATIALQIATRKNIEARMICALLFFNVVLSVFQENPLRLPLRWLSSACP